MNRRITRRRPGPLRLRVRVVGGPNDGVVAVMQPPLPRTFTRDGIRYRVDHVDRRGYVAMTDSSDDHTPVLAWRAWSVTEKPGAITTLASGHDSEWDMDGPLVARCGGGSPAADATEDKPDHSAPNWDCSCGIYCTTTLGTLRSAGFSEPDVYGVLAGWGKVIEHETGWRVARAYPLAIIVNSAASSVDGGVFSDEEAARTLRARVSDLGRAYRVPAILAMPERAVGSIASLVAAGRLYGWAEDAMPSDVRLERTLRKIGKAK